MEFDYRFSLQRQPGKEAVSMAVASTLPTTAVSDGAPSEPIWLCALDDRFVARFAEPVAGADEDLAQDSTAPWVTSDGGLSWSLPRSTSLGQLIDGPCRTAPLTLVAVADGLLVDLGAVGCLTIVGHGPGLATIMRSLLQQLSGHPAGSPTEVLALPGSIPPELYSVDIRPPPGRLFTELRPVDPFVRTILFVTPDYWESHGARFTDTGLGSNHHGKAVVLVAPSPHHLPSDLAGLQLTVDRTTARFGPVRPALAIAPRLRSVGNSFFDSGGDSPPMIAEDYPEVSGPVLNLLGPIELVGAGRGSTASDSAAAARCLTSQQLALTCFLACAGPVGGAAVIDALWGGEAVSASRFPNLLAEVRRRIGARHLPRVTAGLYRLQGIETDLAHFEATVGKASRSRHRPTADLVEAMELVRGVPLGGAGGRYWSWVDSHQHISSRIEGVVVEAAAWVAEVCIERGELDGAQVAYEKGLLASPFDEGLVAALVQLLAAMGRIGAAVGHVEGWEARVRALECGEPPCGPRSVLRATLTARRQNQGPAA